VIIGGFALGVGALVTKVLENTLTAHPFPYKLVSISSIKCIGGSQQADNLYNGLEVSIR
jgi:hypothetical protein